MFSQELEYHNYKELKVLPATTACLSLFLPVSHCFCLGLYSILATFFFPDNKRCQQFNPECDAVSFTLASSHKRESQGTSLNVSLSPQLFPSLFPLSRLIIGRENVFKSESRVFFPLPDRMTKLISLSVRLTAFKRTHFSLPPSCPPSLIPPSLYCLSTFLLPRIYSTVFISASSVAFIVRLRYKRESSILPGALLRH